MADGTLRSQLACWSSLQLPVIDLGVLSDGATAAFKAVLGSSGLRSLPLFFTALEGGVSLDR